LETELSQLKEIVLPGPVSYFPQTPAWYILFGVIIIIIIILSWRFYKQLLKNRYRKQALLELRNIKKESALHLLPALVKRVSLVFADRIKVAGLYGYLWLNFLDESYDGNGFSKGQGRLLVDIAYQDPEKYKSLSKDDIESLFEIITIWIKKHNA